MRARKPSFLCALALALAIAGAPRSRAVIIDFTSGTYDWSNPLAWLIVGGPLYPGINDTARVLGGTLTLDSSYTIRSLNLSGGTLTGTGSLTLTYPGSTWTGGTLSGAGSLTLGSSATLAIGPSSSATFVGRQIVNGGAITWSDGQLNTGSGASIINQSGASFTLTSDDHLLFNQGGARTAITNTGTFAKTGGTGTSEIYASVASTGSINVSSGTLLLGGGGSSSGNVTVGSGSKLKIASTAFEFSNGSIFFGPGAIEISSNTTTFSGTVQGANAAAIIVSGGTATITGNTTTNGGGGISAGFINGAGNLTFGSLFTITGGTINDAGTLNLNGGAAITGTFNTNGGRTINLGANSTWTGGTIIAGNATINLKPGALLTTNFNGSLSISGSTPATFNNQGTFVKSGGEGNTFIDAVFNNSGTLRVSEGNVTLSRGGSSGGLFDIGPDSRLLLSTGNFSITNGAVITGLGTLQVSGANVSFTGNQTSSANLALSTGNLTISGNTSTAGFSVSGGTLTVAGNFTASDPVSISGGTTTGGGNLYFQAGTTFTGSPSFLGNVKVYLEDDSFWNGGTITVGGSSTLTIKSVGSLTTGFDGTIAPSGSGLLVNQGTFTKSAGNGTTTIDVPFANNGTLRALSGTVNLAEGGNSTGTINIASNATVAVGQQTFVLESGSQLTGLGTLRTSGGNTQFVGTHTTATALAVASGNLIISGNTTTTGSFGISGGTLKSPGNLAVGGHMTLAGGTLDGPGNITASGGASIVNNINILGGANFNLASNATWSVGSITLGGNSTFAIKPGSVLATGFDGSMYSTTGGGTLANNGTFTKAGGSGTTLLDVTVNNAGTINVQTGTVNLAEGGSSSGTVNVHPGATLLLNQNTFTFQNGAHLLGNGTVATAGGTTVFSGTHTATSNIALSSGNIVLNGGGLSTSGGGTISGGVIKGSGSLTFGNVVTISGGTIESTGAFGTYSGANIIGSFTANSTNIYLEGNSTWSNGTIYGSGSIITIWSGANLTNTHNGSVAFGGVTRSEVRNLGTITKTTATGTTKFEAIVKNDGKIAIERGTIELAGGGYSAGIVELASDAIFLISGETFAFQSGSTITGAGTVRVTGGTATFSGGNTGSAALELDHSGTMTLSGVTTTSGRGNFDGGTLNGAGTLSFGDLLTLGGGTTLSGTGTLNANGGAVIGGAIYLLGGQTLALGGSSTWSSGAIYGGGSGSTLTIKPGATLTNLHDGNINHNGGGRATVQNQGIFRKTTALGTTAVDAIFNNTGIIDVQTGTLEFDSGGSSSGTVNIGSGATLAIGGGTFAFGSGASINGPGTLKISGSTAVATFAGVASTAHLAIPTGTATFTGLSSVSGTTSLGSGTISGTGTLNLTGPFLITGGTLDGSGILNAQAGMTLSANLNLKGGRTLALGGTSTWTDGTIYGGGDSFLTINPGASLTASGSGSLSSYHGGTITTFRNEGTFTKNTHSGTTQLDAPYTNVGTTRVQTGTVAIKRGGSSSGNIEISAGALFAVENGTFTFDPGSRLFGPGTVLISGGTGVFGGTTTATANISIDYGTATLVGNTVTTGGGTLSAGTINGAGNLTYGAPVTIDGSVTLAGSGVVTAGSNATISSNFSLKDGQNLTLAGTTNLSAQYIYHGTGSTLNNTGTLNETGGLYLYHNYGGAKLVFSNSGSFTKSGAASTSYFDAIFNNSGAVNLQTGTLQLVNGGASSGTVAISDGAKFEVSAGAYAIADGAQVTGAGTLSLVSSGTLTLSGALGVDHFAQNGGTLLGTHTLTRNATVTNGSWDATAPGSSTTLASGAVLNIGGSDFSFDYRQINALAGSKTYWTGGHLRSGNGGSFINQGDFYDRNVSGYSIKRGGFAGEFTFDNRGLYQRETGGITYVDVPFLNSGTINLNQGAMQLRGGGNMAATSIVNAANGTTFTFASDYTLFDGAQLTGTGSYVQYDGTMTINGTLRASNFKWEGGNWNSEASGVTTTIGSGSSLTLHSYNLPFNRRSIAVASGGTVVWEYGYLQGGNGSVFTNQGTFLDNNSSSFSAYVPEGFGGTFSFVNAGTYTRNVTGYSAFDVPFTNTGTVNIERGSIYLAGGGSASSTAVFNVSSDGALYIDSDFTVNGAQFRGTGRAIQTDGTLDVIGALKADNFVWQGGNWNSETAASTSLASGTLLILEGSASKDFNRRSLTIDAGATLQWKAGYLRGGNGSVLINNGTFRDSNVYYDVNAIDGTFSFTNNGTYLRDGAGSTTFTVPFTNNGTINLQSGNMYLEGGGTMSANSVIYADAGTQFSIDSSYGTTSTYTVIDGARFNGPGTFKHSGGTLTLNGTLVAKNFRWTGGDWNSPTAGAVTTIGTGTTLTIAGGGQFDNRTLVIADGGSLVWDSGYLMSTGGGGIINSGIFNDANIYGYSIKTTPQMGGDAYFAADVPLEDTGAMSFTNNGTYRKTTEGNTNVHVPFTNTGTLDLQGGHIYFNSTFTNTGSITFSNGAQLTASSPISFSASTPLSGSGKINGSVTAAGQVSPGNSPGKLHITGTLTLLSTSTLLIELGGNTQGVDYDYLQVGGTATLAGNLSLTFINGYAAIVDATKTFTILSSASLTGAFANIGSGQRLNTIDGLGSFLVTYGSGPNSVVLSQFQAIPEPSTYVMLAIGAGIVLYTVRRRRTRS